MSIVPPMLKHSTHRQPLLLMVIMAMGCSPTSPPTTSVLPDASFPLSTERKANAREEYRLLVSLYGNPDSVASTEKAVPRPKVPNRMARYHVAGVTVALVPHGCEETFDLAMRALAGSVESARIGTKQLKPCVPSRSSDGWTIVGYLDSDKKGPLTVKEATAKLNGMKAKRTAEPVWEY